MSEYYDFGRKLGDLVRGMFCGGGGGGAPGEPPRGPEETEGRPSRFPAAGVDLIQHEIRVRLEFGDSHDETITLYGTMLVQRDEPRRAKAGRREIPFKVLSWAATGWCHTLGASITYALSPDVEQPVSFIRAEGEEADFPAEFLFNVYFDARVDNVTVYKKLHGRPEGDHFLAVPPNGDRKMSPTITRFTDVGRVTVDHPQFGKVVATPVDCNDRSGKTIVTIPGMKRIDDGSKGSAETSA
jgi:hypothetical protein